MAYAECFVLALPLRDCAAVCGVCLKISFTMRPPSHRGRRRVSPAFAVRDGCGCELDETHFRESFKGNHTKGPFKMPRKPRRHGGKPHKRGLSKERICVMTGVSDAGELFLDLVGRGSLSSEWARAALEGRVRSGRLSPPIRRALVGARPPALRHRGLHEDSRHVQYWAAVHGLLSRVGYGPGGI